MRTRTTPKTAVRNAGQSTWWLVAGAGLLAACGSDGAQPTADSTVGASDSPTPPQLGGQSGVEGGPELPLIVAELRELANRTTPDAIEIELRANFDHVAIRAHLLEAGGNPITSCQVADVYRIGRNAVSWPIGGTFTLPLAYPEALPPGLYVQSVRIYMNGAELDAPGESQVYQYFEVIGGGLHPITSTEYSDRVMPVMYDSNGEPYYTGGSVSPDYEPPPEPCPKPEPYSDEVSMDEAMSSVDFDSWANVGTRQPFRWNPSPPAPPGGSSPPSLELRARNAAGGRMRLMILAPVAELGSAFEVSLGGPSGQATLALVEPDLVGWYGSAGRISVQPAGSARLRVEFSEVVLDKSRMITEPEVTRAVAAGSIVGAWARE